MKLWYAPIDISEPEACSTFPEMPFYVPDELYEKAASYLRKGEKLPKDVEKELVKLARADIDLDTFDLYPEELPTRDEYGSDEDCEKNQSSPSLGTIKEPDITDMLEIDLDFLEKELARLRPIIQGRN